MPTKETEHGRRRMAEFTAITNDGVMRGPELPEGEWPPPTVAYYSALRTSPMAKDWLEVDWLNLHDVMRLHAAYVNGDLKHAPELRLRLAQYGVTPEARLRLRLLVTEPTQSESRLDQMRRERDARINKTRPSRPQTKETKT